MENLFLPLMLQIGETVGRQPDYTLLRILLLVLVGLPVVYLVSTSLKRILKKRLNEHVGLMVGKFAFIIGSFIIIFMALHELGFNLTALLGAAGIISVAIGFAAQTSLSNVISGLFIYWERPFKVGDIIKVGDCVGIVLAIDLMSIKLRQFDNLFVRIPNETVIKSQVTTITRFPIRRVDINIGVAYKEDTTHVINVLKQVADENPYALNNPEPLILFKEFGDSSLNFILGLWVEKSNFIQLKNSAMQDIKKRFDEEGIEIPFPHRTLYPGAESEPFPIKVVKDHPSYASS